MLSFLAGIKNRLLYIVNFSSCEQYYKAVYEVKITNKESRSFSTSVVIPVPKNTSSQTISNVSFSHPGTQHIENTYGNVYYVAHINIDGQKTETMNMSFNARVLPKTSSFTDKHSPLFEKRPPVYNRFISNSVALQNEAQQIPHTSKNIMQTINYIYEHVNKRLSYGNPIAGLYTCDEALTKKNVDCGGFVTFFVSLCNFFNIPAMPVFGFFAGYSKNTMHAWAIIQDKAGKEYVFDPSSDWLRKRGRTIKSGGFLHVGSDRIVFSKGCDYAIEVRGEKKYIDILQNAFCIENTDKLLIETTLKTTRL